MYSRHTADTQCRGKYVYCLFAEGGKLTVTDLDSTNGTFINDQELTSRMPTPLALGSEVVFGAFLVHFFYLPFCIACGKLRCFCVWLICVGLLLAHVLSTARGCEEALKVPAQTTQHCVELAHD